MPYAAVNGVSLFFEAGGQGQPLVYVHGGFAGLSTVLPEPEAMAWSWEHDLAGASQFVTYDRLGCARSSSPEGGYDLVTQARDLAGLLAHLSITTAHIIGSSAGGPIAFTFAALFPQMTRSLVLTGTAIDLFPPGEPDSDLVRRHLVILERDGPEAAFDQRPAGVEVSFNELWDEKEAAARGTLDTWSPAPQRYPTRKRYPPTPLSSRL